MGLDMRPMGKSKPGFEKRFNQILRIILGKEDSQVNPQEKLATREELIQELLDNQIVAFETIQAPQVGRDKEANDWALNKYAQTDKTVPEHKFIQQLDGYYVVELAKEKDGVPVYLSFHQHDNVFRGQCIIHCIDLIGEELVNEAWETKLADETLAYGQTLMGIADTIAQENNLQYLKDQRLPPDTDEDSMESKLHIIYSLAKWLIFYGKNGHGYEADF